MNVQLKTHASTTFKLTSISQIMVSPGKSGHSIRATCDIKTSCITRESVLTFYLTYGLYEFGDRLEPSQSVL